MKPASETIGLLPAAGVDAMLDHTLVTAFLESIPDLVYFKDCESRFIAVSRSKAARHGLEAAELVGKTDANFFAEQHAQWARVDEENIINTGEPIIGKQEKIDWPDGRSTWSLSSKLPLRDADGTIIGTFGISQDVTKARELEHQLEKIRKDLVDISRLAGMAEVATGVLHNVGNVLNSLNISATMIVTGIRDSRIENLAKLCGLLRDHKDDLAEFVTQDPRGRRIPEFVESLAQHLTSERNRLLREIDSLQTNVDHIKEIVSMQQAYATMVGVVEPLDPSGLMEDALRMNSGALVRHDIQVVRVFDQTPRVVAEKAKILQILVNLIRNAKYACDEGPNTAAKLVTLRIGAGVPGRVQLIVQDNGIGIAPENLPRIFSHGFTTRADGHGFGLHSSSEAARQVKGSLIVQSDGLGRGATFTLDLPAAPDSPTTAQD